MKDIEIVPADQQENELQETKSRNDEIMLRAVETGNVDALEKLITLRANEEARQARLVFEKEFSKLQADLKPVKKTKTNKGTSSKYAPLDYIQSQCDSIISEHGFSYWWDEENTETGKTTTLFISGYGHTKPNTFSVPQLEGTRAMNAVQIAAAMSTYGQRYTFIAGFGITVEGEDSDAGGITEGTGEEYADEVLSLDSSGTIEELMATWRNLYPKIQNNDSALRYLTTVKDQKKKALSGR